MKKVTALILCMTTVLMFGACGNNAASEVDKTASADTSIQKAETDNSLQTLAIGTPVYMDEQIMYDDNGIIITAKSLQFDGLSEDFCAFFFYEVTNNTETDIRLSYHTFDINGISVHTPHNTDVVKQGETAQWDIILNQNCAEWNDIRVIKDISFNLKIEGCHAHPDYPDEYVVDTVIVENTGDLTATTKYIDQYAAYEQKLNKEGTVLFETENVALIFNELTVVKNEYDPNILDLDALIYCKNNYDRRITVSFTAQKANGEEIPKEGDKFEFPLQSEGIRHWFELDISFDTIDTMEFVYKVTDTASGDVLLESAEPITVTVTK